MDQSGSETYSPRSFDWHLWISVDHLLITSNQVPPILEWFCSIMPVTTDPESQPRAVKCPSDMFRPAQHEPKHFSKAAPTARACTPLAPARHPPCRPSRALLLLRVPAERAAPPSRAMARLPRSCPPTATLGHPRASLHSGSPPLFALQPPRGGAVDEAAHVNRQSMGESQILEIHSFGPLLMRWGGSKFTRWLGLARR